MIAAVHRTLLALTLAFAFVALQPALSDAAGDGPTGKLRGGGQCALTSSESFVCEFGGRFRGRVEGVARTGTWSLRFGVHETRAGYEVWDQPAPRFRLVLPKTTAQARIVATAVGPFGGTIAANAEHGFDLSLDFALTGGLAFDVTVDGTFGPSTELHAPGSRMPALFDMIDPQASGSRMSSAGQSLDDAGHGAVLFTGSGRGRGECFVTSSVSLVCVVKARFAGKLNEEVRRGTILIQVYAEDAVEAGTPRLPFNPKELSVDRVVMAFAATDTRPARLLRFGPDGTGTVLPNTDKGLDFTIEASLPAGHFVVRAAFICKWEGPEFDASKNEVSIESLEIVHEGIS